MKTRLVVNLVAVLWLLSAQFAQAVSPTPAEMAEVRRWAAAKFEGVPDTKDPDFGLQVMANNGPVQANGRGGQPLRIGDKQYTRGLYCHAVSKVIVRLPSPGKTFTALAGGDRNAGGGSVVFSVSVGEKSLFKSGLMRGGMPGVEPFFSFTYDGKPSAELLKTWELKRASRPLDDKRTQHTLTYDRHFGSVFGTPK
jgi:NPCBM/NEW2 domain